jgi:GTP cyclohydrolase I
MLTASEELSFIIGDVHQPTAAETPLRIDAFEKTDEEKIEAISGHFARIMEELGLDLTDDSLKGTPYRVAHMYVKEIFSGLHPGNKPRITLFENKYKYKEMLIEKNISFFSNCEHHFVPITGKVHIGYFSSGKVIGLSKLNRIVHYYAHRPQVQERMTVQIAEELKSVLNTKDVAVVADAFHHCVSARGVKDIQSSTITSHFDGAFKREDVRSEFLSFIK